MKNKQTKKISFFLTKVEKQILHKKYLKTMDSKQAWDKVNDFNKKLNHEALKLRRKKSETLKDFEKRQKQVFNQKFHEMCMREEAKRR